MLPKPAHLPSTGLSSLAGQTPALSQAQTLRPQLPTGFPHIAHLLCYLFIYLFEEKKGRNFFATVYGESGEGNKRDRVYNRLSSLCAFLSVTCPEDL